MKYKTIRRIKFVDAGVDERSAAYIIKNIVKFVTKCNITYANIEPCDCHEEVENDWHKVYIRANILGMLHEFTVWLYNIPGRHYTLMSEWSMN